MGCIIEDGNGKYQQWGIANLKPHRSAASTAHKHHAHTSPKQPGVAVGQVGP